MTHPCGRCGAEGILCGCDVDAMLPRLTLCRGCCCLLEEPEEAQGRGGLCWGCFKGESGKQLVRAERACRKEETMTDQPSKRKVGIWLTFGKQIDGKVELNESEVEVETPQGDLYLKREDAADLAAAL